VQVFMGDASFGGGSSWSVSRLWPSLLDVLARACHGSPQHIQQA